MRGVGWGVGKGAVAAASTHACCHVKLRDKGGTEPIFISFPSPVYRTALPPSSLPSSPQVRNVEGEGMPVHQVPSQRGVLSVKYIVDLPRTLTDEQKAAVEKYFA